jgi:enamine deaminase RidA (YjgF/YER057c/UK114 family)
MGLERIQPEGIHEARGYTHVVRAKGERIAYISGQVGVAPDGSVPDGLEAQAKQAFGNLAACLDAAGARPSDVAKITIYIVNYDPGKRAALLEARTALWPTDPPASTLIGVQALASPAFEIEVEAIAVFD